MTFLLTNLFTSDEFPYECRVYLGEMLISTRKFKTIEECRAGFSENEEILEIFKERGASPLEK